MVGTSQQERKEQEGAVVRRLTIGAGAAALGLAWYFTSSAATAAPLAFGAQPAAAEPPVVGIEQLDDRVFVRTVHVPAMRAPAGGVKAGAARPAAGQAAGSGAPAQPVAAPATPAPTPAPTPVATTGGSAPPR
ncbi:MAG TPA: hypothetical protein VKF59_05690 [Candidatus Dormibacteraeota bacterium]|nr:hypothetical protein [Candidatus Dormibacteraeota bacterium]